MTSKVILALLITGLMIAAAFVVGVAADSERAKGPVTAERSAAQVLTASNARPGLFMPTTGGFLTQTNSGPVAFLPDSFILYAGKDRQCLRIVFADSQQCAPQGFGQGVATNRYVGSGSQCTSARSYTGLRYEAVWPGIDLEFYNRGGNLKYQYVLDAGANPNDIVLHVEGTTVLSITSDGSLSIDMPGGGNVLDSGLVAFYTDSPSDLVRAKFQLMDQNTYTLNLGGYDARRSVTIDPMLYSALIGGNNFDNACKVALDELGNAYVLGTTQSTDLDVTADAITKTNAGKEDIFIMKVSPDGKNIYYLTYLGGSDMDLPVEIELDEDDNIYVTGQTFSNDFPVTPNAYDRTYNQKGDTFVLKLSNTGKELIYSTYMGGNADDGPLAIAVETGGYVYISGHTNSTNYPTSKDAFQKNHTGLPCDSFVFKLNPAGTALIYSTMVGGKFPDGGRAMAIDDQGHAYVTGGTKSPNFPTTPGAYKRNHTGTSCDFFVYKLSTNGSKLEYSTLIGGTGDLNRASGILVDKDGSVFVCGETMSSDYPMTAGTYDATYNGGQDIIVLKLDPTGGQLLHSTFFGGTGGEGTADICFDNVGNICITGNTNSTDLPVTKRCYDSKSNGMDDAFVIKFDPTLTKLLYSTYQGANNDDSGFGIASDREGNLVVCGESKSEIFPITAGVFSVGFAGGKADGFLFKLNATEEPEDDFSIDINTCIALLLIIVIALVIAFVLMFFWQRHTAKVMAEEEAQSQKKGRGARGTTGRPAKGQDGGRTTRGARGGPAKGRDAGKGKPVRDRSRPGRK